MLRRVTLVRTDVSEELSAPFIRVTRIGELGATLAVTSNRRTQRLEYLSEGRVSTSLRNHAQECEDHRYGVFVPTICLNWNAVTLQGWCGDIHHIWWCTLSANLRSLVHGTSHRLHRQIRDAIGRQKYVLISPFSICIHGLTNFAFQLNVSALISTPLLRFSVYHVVYSNCTTEYSSGCIGLVADLRRNIATEAWTFVHTVHNMFCSGMNRSDCTVCRLAGQVAILWDVTLCGDYENRRFGGTKRLHHQDDKNRRARNNVSSN
jgi:hypothetical protein